jgi:hypothetical protein
MNNYLTYTAPLSFRSKFNPVVGLHPDFLGVFNEIFLNPLFLKMCSSLSISPVDFEFLPIEELITEKEFENIKNLELAKPYFYEILFNKIAKNHKGRIKNSIKFTFTYDIDLTPIQKGDIRYGVISLGNKPIFYYCYVDFHKAIQFIKSLE